MRKSAIVFSLVIVSICNVFALATEPTSQPTNMQFGSVKAYSLVMSFTPTVADGYLVIKSDQPITFAPVDATTYEKGQGVTGAKVMYVGGNNILSAREILEGTTYYFKVFAYNGSGNQTNYLQINPLSNSVMSAASSEGSYYSGIDSTSGTFVDDLHARINNHIMVAYTAYKSNIVPVIFERDTIGAQKVINCEYSNETTLYTGNFDFTAQAYNREHTLCKSWMQTAAIFGANNLIDSAEGADYYNLLLTRSTPNNTRSNNPLGIVVNVTSTYGESKYGKDNTGNNVFEPKPNRKGDAARAMFYQMVCYDGLSGGWGLDELLSEATDQDQDILKLWNQQDPPDKFERTKNEYISSLQKNRNPFIDHPAWAACINFDSLLKTNLCGAVSGVEDVMLNVGVSIYPNPASEILNVELMTADFSEFEVSVIDIYGREFLKSEVRSQKSEINTSSFEEGNYLLKISTSAKSTYRRFLIVR